MQDDTGPKDPAKTLKPASRPSKEDRLKAALKANMARRKAQARGRAATVSDDEHNNEQE